MLDSVASSNEAYLFNAFDREDISMTIVFLNKATALQYIAKNFFLYEKKAENVEEDITLWGKNNDDNYGLTLERVKLIRQ